MIEQPTEEQIRDAISWAAMAIEDAADNDGNYERCHNRTHDVAAALRWPHNVDASEPWDWRCVIRDLSNFSICLLDERFIDAEARLGRALRYDPKRVEKAEASDG